MNEELRGGIGMQSNTDCEPPRQIGEMPMLRNKIREVRIFQVLNGFVVFCGCQQVVFTDKDKMLSEIGRYIDTPEAVEKEYLGQK